MPHWHGNGYDFDIMNIFKSCIRGGEYILPIHPVKLFNSRNVFLHFCPKKCSKNKPGKSGGISKGHQLTIWTYGLQNFSLRLPGHCDLQNQMGFCAMSGIMMDCKLVHLVEAFRV